MSRPEKLISAAVWALALYYLAVFIFLALRHISYPFELEWMEGGMLDHVCRLLQGKALYGAPALEFTAFSYAPLYFYLSAALGHIFAADLALLRAISVVATLATVLLIGFWIRQESGSWRMGALASALYLATYPVSGAWFDLARVDSLFLLLLIGGFYLLRRSRTVRGAVASALLLVLAFFCKQTALVITLPMLLYIILFVPSPRRWAFLVTYGALLAGGLYYMEAASHGWFSYYLFYLPGQHQAVYWRIHHFWIDYFLKPLPFALLSGAVYFYLARKKPGRQSAFWIFALAGLFGGPWLASVPSGAFHNVAMPAHAAAAMLFALGTGRWQSASGRKGEKRSWRRPSWNLLPLGLAVLQLLILLFNPLKYLPSSADRQAGEELVQRLAAAPGPVWIPGHGYLAQKAGKKGSAHSCALDDVLRGKEEPGKIGLVCELGEAIRGGRYAVVITDDAWLAGELQGGYAPARKIFKEAGRFYPMTGWQTRPEHWYERLESASPAPDERQRRAGSEEILISGS